MITMVQPVVGNKIKALIIPGVTGTARDERSKFTGQTVTITRISTNSWRDDAGWHDNATVAYGMFTNHEGREEEFWISMWEPVYDDAPYEPIIELTEDQKKIADLEKQLTDVRNKVGAWEQWALGVVEKADEEAEERGWCDTYDEIRARVIRDVPTPVAFPFYGDRDYLVTWEEEVRFRIKRRATVTAKSADDAIEQIQNDFVEFDFSDLREAYQDNNYEVIDSSEWDAEED
jgi:hypothetical protein